MNGCQKTLEKKGEKLLHQTQYCGLMISVPTLIEKEGLYIHGVCFSTEDLHSQRQHLDLFLSQVDVDSTCWQAVIVFGVNISYAIGPGDGMQGEAVCNQRQCELYQKRECSMIILHYIKEPLGVDGVEGLTPPSLSHTPAFPSIHSLSVSLFSNPLSYF